MRPGGGETTRLRRGFREIAHRFPNGDAILVGRWMGPELEELRATAWWLGGIGTFVLLTGLIIGWWLVSRAMQPVKEISSTAVRIAAGDLKQRINTSDADSELGQLAGVLNSTFARLDAAFSQQARFTSDAAHELRTPTAVMLTQTQMALARERSAGEYRETIEACHRAAQRMRRLIESLLELARFDAGQTPIRKAPFDLSQTVAENVSMLRPLAEQHGVTVSVEGVPTTCMGDPERISQVVTNLVSNAIQYNREGGKVTVRTQPDPGAAIIAVEDTGVGIAEDDLPHIFDRFFRVDEARLSKAGNTGLGLAIARAIVEAHEGSIRVASTQGVGTVFTVKLPLASVAAQS
jgi:two-component system, OmpR family, sensor kinase